MPRPIGILSGEILKKLDHGALAMNDLFDFLASRALEGESHLLSKEGYRAFKRRSWQRRVALNAEHQAAEEKQRFHSLMYHLQKQGLITKEKNGVKTVVSVTKKGMEKYRALKKYLTGKNPEELSLSPRKYPKIKSPSSIIISFDIPEKENHKRAWLRSVLRNLNYKILHASVWIGKNAMPQEFLNDCRRIGIMKYLHIFSVVETGTIAKAE